MKPCLEKEINQIDIFITFLLENVNIQYHQKQIMTIKLLKYVIMHMEHAQLSIE